MVRFVLSGLLFLAFTLNISQAQTLGDLGKTAGDLLKGGKLSQDEMSAGIKEALLKGVTNGTDQASSLDGFFKNPEIKIPFPKNARKVAKSLKKIGMEKQVDEFVKSLNRSAELAAAEAKPIFMDAVKEMTIQDAVKILDGKDKLGATNYLKRTTADKLSEKIHPLIAQSLESTKSAQLYKDLIKRYNKLPFVKKESANLEDYATQKTLQGLFHLIGKEEIKIRENPGARTSDLLKKVFGK